MKEFVRTLNLNSKEIVYKVQALIYDRCAPMLTGYPKASQGARCDTSRFGTRSGIAIAIPKALARGFQWGHLCSADGCGSPLC